MIMGKLMAAILIMISVNSYSMRCGNHVVDSGESDYQLRNDCGTPDDTYSDYHGDTVVRTYKLDDGSVWSVRSINGTIDSVDMSR
jgi:hypothetical protein